MMAKTLEVVGPKMKDELKIFKVRYLQDRYAPTSIGIVRVADRTHDKLPA